MSAKRSGPPSEVLPLSHPPGNAASAALWHLVRTPQAEGGSLCSDLGPPIYAEGRSEARNPSDASGTARHGTESSLGEEALEIRVYPVGKAGTQWEQDERWGRKGEWPVKLRLQAPRYYFTRELGSPGSDVSDLNTREPSGPSGVS